MDTLASQFIDDELDLDEKITFVHQVNQNKSFFQEVVELLHLEKLMRCPDAVPQAPAVQIKSPQRHTWMRLWRPTVLVGACAGALAMALLWIGPAKPPVDLRVAHRFVLYQPQAAAVQIVGSFTDWQARPLQKTGESGYWEVTLTVPPGEHRFAYLLDDSQRMADPTISIREQDDFGGENSILKVDV